MRSNQRAVVSILVVSSFAALTVIFQNCTGNQGTTTGVTSASSLSPSSTGTVTTTSTTPAAGCWTYMNNEAFNTCDGGVDLGPGPLAIGNQEGINFNDSNGNPDSQIFEGVGGNLNILAGAGGFVKFLTKTQATATLDSSGNFVLLGNLSVENTKSVLFFNSSQVADARIFEGNSNNLNLMSGTGGYIKFMNQAQTVGAYFDSQGNWYTSGSFQNSDRRLKTDIQPLKGVLARLEKIDGVTYEWKDAGRRKNDGSQIGVIAQDVQNSFPELVKESESLGTSGPAKKVLSVDYSHLTAVVLAGLKELANDWRGDSKSLHEENEQLKSKVQSLEARLSALEAKGK